MIVGSRRTFLAGAGTLCAGAPVAVRAQTPTHVVLGTAPTDSGSPPVIAQRTGIYRRYGLDVDVQFMGSGAALVAAVIGGTLQIGTTSTVGLVTAHAKGIPLQIVAPTSIYLTENPGELLLVRKDSPIRSGADMNGKTIASPAFGDLISTATFAWIDQHGGDSKTVHSIELPSAATPAALAAGRIDAAAMNEPRLSEALQSGNFRSIGKPYDAIAPRFLVACFVVTAEFGNAHPELLARFARAHHETNVFANAHPEQTAVWLAEIAKLEPAAIQRGRRETFAETLAVADVQRVVDAAARFKLIERAFDARELISPAVLNLRF
jgi:NitT/TauT family transport system substrate-binding protein